MLSSSVSTQGRTFASTGPPGDVTRECTTVSGSVARRSPTVGLVAYLFAISGRDELPGPALVELLGELGLTPAAARQLFVRMRAAGQLAGHRSGRRTVYRLAGPVARQVAALAGPPPSATWDGRFH